MRYLLPILLLSLIACLASEEYNGHLAQAITTGDTVKLVLEDPNRPGYPQGYFMVQGATPWTANFEYEHVEKNKSYVYIKGEGKEYILGLSDNQAAQERAASRPGIELYTGYDFGFTSAPNDITYAAYLKQLYSK